MMKMAAMRFALLGLLLGGCASAPVHYDYQAFQRARPVSILVLPPLNLTPDIAASHSLMAVATLPLAESGYYVLPVTLVDETFRQNGLQDPAEIAEVSAGKLREIFGADAALYIEVEQYGTVYQVLQSETVVAAKARLMDLRSGELLWEGSARASNAENRGSAGQAGLLGYLVEALVHQILDSVTDASHGVAEVTSTRLLAAGRPGGILFGPRSPQYQAEAAAP